MAAPKIIVLGSLNGQLEPAFKKLAALHSKNSFSLAILTGDIFPASADDETVSALLDGRIEVPLPTYFTIGNHALPPRLAAKIQADEELCPNLHYLGKRSITKTSDGVRIVALGGLLDPNLVAGQSKEQHLPFHSADDARSLRGANSADILLTSTWPADVWSGSKVALDAAHKLAVPSSEDIAELCAALKPRYHLSASPDGFFYEREPFVHPLTDNDATQPASSITRFISMAPWGNESKAKAMYAFTLNKADTTTLPPPGTTPSPFLSKQSKRARRDDDGGFNRYSHHHDDHHGRRNKKRRRASPPPGPDRCYFCLSNPNLSSHMCCSIGDESYVTTAKGPLPTATTFADRGLALPAHFIIIPLPHAPTITSMGITNSSGDAGDAAKTLAEMDRFREALQAMISARSSHRLGAVTWEISRDRNVHLIWQLIAVPAELITNGVVEAAFRVEAQNLEYPPLTARHLTLEDLPAQGDFFRVWLWADNGEDRIKSQSLVMPLGSDARFDLQFGRRVLAKLLGLDDRFSWQACEQTVDEEVKDVEAFREAFKEWDFTLQ